MDLHRRKLWVDRFTWLLVAGATAIIAYQFLTRGGPFQRYLFYAWTPLVVLMLLSELRVGRSNPRPGPRAFFAGWAKYVGEELVDPDGERRPGWRGTSSGVLEFEPAGVHWRSRAGQPGPDEILLPWPRLHAWQVNGVVPLVWRASGYLTFTVDGGRELVFHVQGLRRWRKALREAAIVGPTFVRPEWLPDEPGAEFPRLLADEIQERVPVPAPAPTLAGARAAETEAPPTESAPAPEVAGRPAQAPEEPIAAQARELTTEEEAAIQQEDLSSEEAAEAAAQGSGKGATREAAPAEGEAVAEAVAAPPRVERPSEPAPPEGATEPAPPPKREAELEPVIGLECHVELSTASKVFCGCPTEFGAEPNTHVCAVCTGQPGSLPVLNEKAVEYALRIALALNCDIAAESIFHRKNYFYPDMPKNYQISQYDVPLATGGWLDLEADGERRRIGIHRVHLEEDTGKTSHAGATGRIAGAEYTRVDYNRAGVPLVEIVSEPDIRSPEEARTYVSELRALLEALGVSDVRMEQGSLRVDANVSVRHTGTSELGVKVEVKNMNSLRSVQRALEFEIDRLSELIRAGKTVMQETRHFDENTGRTSGLRSKEYSEDYRYFRDPDLVPLAPEAAWIGRIRASLPELPAERRRRFVDSYGLSAVDARTLTASKGLADALENSVRAYGGDAKAIARWYTAELAAVGNERGVEPHRAGVSPEHVADLQRLVDAGELSMSVAKGHVLRQVAETGRSPREIVRESGLTKISNAGELEAVVDEVVSGNPDVVDKIRGGKEGAVNVLFGQIMKRTQGRADARVVRELLDRRLASV